jgi:hypothetical protein
MREFVFVSALAAVLVVSAGASHAQDRPVGFRSPSGNVHCQLFKDGGDATVRCDIRQMTNAAPPRPRDCEQDWGQAFEIADAATSGKRICHGDTVADDALRILAYGAEWEQEGFTCTSEQAGVTCVNEDGHGFELSRGAQRLF